MITVLIADDQDLVRMGLRTLLEHAEGFNVVGEAADGLAAVDRTRELHPDVVLMDIRMPGIDGLTATERLLSDPELSGTRVLVLTTFEHDEYVFQALRNGACGFLLKNTPPAQLLEAIKTVADGGSLLAPSVTRTLINKFTQLSPTARSPHPQLADLTPREREVMALVGRGLSNDEIAERLVVSPATARTPVSRAMVKLAARDRAQLVVFAFQSGLV